MTAVTIEWGPLSRRALYEGCGLVYSVISNDAPILFGYTCAKDRHAAARYSSSYKAAISHGRPWFGRVSCSDTEVTRDLLRDIKKLLVRFYNPIYNDANVLSYNGTDPLLIKNRGCEGIHPAIAIMGGVRLISFEGDHLRTMNPLSLSSRTLDRR